MSGTRVPMEQPRVGDTSTKAEQPTRETTHRLATQSTVVLRVQADSPAVALKNIVMEMV